MDQNAVEGQASVNITLLKTHIFQYVIFKGAKKMK